jgi:dihydroneopterin aldolase
MDELRITGIQAKGFHGLFDFEQRDGQIFLVDLLVKGDLSKAGNSDSIEDTVDYGAMTARVKELIESGPYRLIERLAEVIATSLKEEFALSSIEVTVHKPEAPVGVKVDDISVTIRR